MQVLGLPGQGFKFALAGYTQAKLPGCVGCGYFDAEWHKYAWAGQFFRSVPRKKGIVLPQLPLARPSPSRAIRGYGPGVVDDAPTVPAWCCWGAWGPLRPDCEGGPFYGGPGCEFE